MAKISTAKSPPATATPAGEANQQTRMHYDRAGQPVRIEQQADEPDNHHLTDEPSGLLSTVQHYDSLGRLTRHIDAAQAETRIEYDSSGQVRQVTAANEARTPPLAG